jgi:hypothetical protein
MGLHYQMLSISYVVSRFRGASSTTVVGAVQHNLDLQMAQASMSVSPSDAVDVSDDAYRGVGWSGNALQRLTSLGLSADATTVLIAPELNDSGLPALVLVTTAMAPDPDHEFAQLLIDATGLPAGSFVHVEPGMECVTVIYRGGQQLTVSHNAQLVRDPAGGDEPAQITLTAANVTDSLTAGVQLNTDDLRTATLREKDHVSILGSAFADTVTGTHNGLVYHYSGGEDRVNYSGNYGNLSIGANNTLRLGGNYNLVQVMSDTSRESDRVGRWVSTGSDNILEFGFGIGGLSFSLQDGHGQVSCQDTSFWGTSQRLLATYRGFAAIKGTMGADSFTISESLTSMRAEATPMAWHGGGGDDSYTITGSDGHQLSLGLGNNTVVLDSAVGTVVATARAEPERDAGNNTITLQRGATLEAVLMGNSVITSDTSTAWDWAGSDSWVRAKVSGGTHTIDLEGQASIISVDARRASNTTVDNLVVTPGHATAQDRATQLQQVLLGSNANFSLLAGMIDNDIMELVSVNTSGAVVARLRLTGNLDEDMLVMWGVLADDEGVDSTSQRRAYRGDHLIQAIATSGTATPTAGGSGVATIAREAGWTRYLNLATLTAPPLAA